MKYQLFPLTKPINEIVSIPGSKSYTNRGLLLASLTKNRIQILNPLYSDDTKAMIDCLTELGIKIKTSPESIEVLGSIADIQDKKYNLNANLSGTTIRFILALSCIIPGVKKIYGDDGLNKRPIKELVEGLKQLGAEIEYLEKKGFPPLLVKSSKLIPGITKLNGDISSQYFSAILMIAPQIGDLTIKVTGEQISKSYIDMTIDTMETFGVKVINQDYKEYRVKNNQQYKIDKYTVEGDYSSASYFFAIAALNKSKITALNLNPYSKQGDKNFLAILEKMGNKIIYGENQVTVEGTVGVKPIDIDMENCPDQVQTLAVLTSSTSGITTITGARSLRVKETERIQALENELAKMGVKTESTHDSLKIHGGNPKPATISTYGDHRMAMSFAVIGSKLEGMRVENPEVVSKTFPEFWQKLNKIGVRTTAIKEKNIVLIGMRGSGKTTVAKLLAKSLKKEYLELDQMLSRKLALPISEIVAKKGWDYFRKQEAQIVKIVSKDFDKIISTGGGVILNSENIENLKENGIIIFLNTKPQTLFKRIGYDKNRPALTNLKDPLDELKEILNQRMDLYKNAADYIIDTDSLSLEKVCQRVLTLIDKPNASNICLVIGDPIDHSLSPIMHNAGYKALGIDRNFNYKKKLVKIEDLKKFIESLKDSNIRGVSLTMPHKLEALKYLDNIDETAIKIGAVNTIVNNNGLLTGYNTDWLGVVTPIEKITSLKGKKVAIIGAGGAARAAVYGFVKSGSKVTIFNRTIETAKKMAEEFDCSFASFDNLDQIKNMDIIFNATSVGMEPAIKDSPVPKEFLEKTHIVYDAIYAPLQTQLIKEAKNKGAQAIYGLEMLLYQGIAQFELFTNQKAPVEAMRKALQEKIK